MALDMFSREKRYLSLPLLTALLFGGWTAEAAHNGSEVRTVSPTQLSNNSSIVVKEGSNTLIECNVTRGHDDIKWFSPKGDLLGEGAGRTSLEETIVKLNKNKD